MPLPYHLIDGYNLLHAAGLARATYGPGDLERARTGLLVRLADGLGDSERERATVVFDAADPPPDADRSFRFRGMAVFFAVEQREADALIEELIRRHPSPRQLRVVSDDLRIQKAAKRRGAQAVKSEVFLERLRRRAAPTGDCSLKDADAAGEAGGVRDWLEFFGMNAGEIAVEDAAASPPQGSTVEPKAQARGVQPPAADGLRPARPHHSPAERREPSSSTAAGDAVADEDFAFWQRRLDELIDEERRRPEAG